MTGKETDSDAFDENAGASDKKNVAEGSDMTTRPLNISPVDGIDQSNSHSPYHKRLPDENNGEFPDTIEIAKAEDESNGPAASSMPRDDFDLLKESQRNDATEEPLAGISKEIKDRKQSPTEMREALYKIEEEA